MDVKNTVEVLDAVTSMAKKMKEILADGQMSGAEAFQLAWSEYKLVWDAIDDANKIPSELGDLDAAEAKLVADKAFKMADALVAVFKK